MNISIKSHEVLIRVSAYSHYASGISVPDFDSIRSFGSDCVRRFVCGVGCVLDRGSSADMYPKGTNVTFCGFCSHTLKETIVTNTNNITRLDEVPAYFFAIGGYVALFLNAIDKLEYSIGESILIDTDDNKRKLFSEIITCMGGIPVFPEMVSKQNAPYIGAAILTEESSCAWEMCSRTARIILLGNHAPINGFGGQKFIHLSEPGDLALDSRVSLDACPYPKHYITSSIKAKLSAANHVIQQLSHNSGFPDLVKFMNIVPLTNYENLLNEKSEERQHRSNWMVADILRDKYANRIDAGILNLLLMVQEPKHSTELAYSLLGYIINCAVSEKKENILKHSISTTFTCVDGSVAVCNIVEFPRTQYKIELHFDGTSHVFTQGHGMAYDEIVIKEESSSPINANFADSVKAVLPHGWLSSEVL